MIKLDYVSNLPPCPLKEKIVNQELLRKATTAQKGIFENKKIVQIAATIIQHFGSFSSKNTLFQNRSISELKNEKQIIENILTLLTNKNSQDPRYSPYLSDLTQLNHSVTKYLKNIEQQEFIQESKLLITDEKNCLKFLSRLIAQLKMEEVIHILRGISTHPQFEKIIYKTVCKITTSKSNNKISLVSVIINDFLPRISEKTFRKWIVDLLDTRVKKIIIEKRYPHLQFQSLLDVECGKLFDWINLPNKIPSSEKHSEKDLESKAAQLVENYLKIVGSFSSPCMFFEPFDFEQVKKETYLHGELIDALYRSNNPEVVKRARLVLKHIGKYDTFFPKLFALCDKMVLKKATVDEIDQFVGRVLNQRHVKLRLPFLRPHTISKKSLSLLSEIQFSTCEKNGVTIGTIKKIGFGFTDPYMFQLAIALQEIGWQEKFQVSQIDQKNPWLRDVLFKLRNGTFLYPQVKKRSVKELDLLVKKLMKDLPNFNDSDPLLRDTHMGQVFTCSDYTKLSSTLPIKQSRFYFEGGNLLMAKNREGKSIILSGAMNILWSYIVGKHEGIFEDSSIQLRASQKIQQLEKEGVYTPELLSHTMKKLQLIGLLPPSNPENAAKLAIAEIEIVKECLAEDLGGDVCFLESGYGFDQNQTSLHIDMNMTAAANGVIFLHDDAKSIEVLENLLKMKDLHPMVKIRYEEYLVNAKKLHQRDGKRLLDTKKQLESWGFQVCLIPGKYVAIDGEINYVNGICANGGLSSQFVITNGFRGIPGEEHLRDAVTMAFQAGGVESVYFAGRMLNRYLDTEPTDTISHFNASAWGGLHCRTLEIE